MARKSTPRGKRRKKSNSGGRLQLLLAVALLFIAVLVLLWRAGPSDPPERPVPTGDVPASETSPARSLEPVQPEALPDISVVRARADRLVARLQDALNTSDAPALAELSAIPPEIPDADAARAALRDYRQFFDGADIARTEHLESTSGTPSIGEDARFLYELVAENGTRKTVLMYYDARFDTLRAYDEFLRYSGRVHAYTRDVAAALRSSDARELAALLSVDDVAYPTRLADEALSHYRERFDLTTLDVVFTGLAPGNSGQYRRAFQFEVRGTLGGRATTHSVRIEPTDGLLNWRDPFVPAPPAQ